MPLILDWRRWTVIGALLVTAPLAAAGPPAPPPERDRSRAELLYETHCIGCHTSVLHVRSNHRATSMADVYDWVRHWAGYQKLGWSDDDVAEVTAFLASRYYRFDQPAVDGTR